MSKEDKKLWRRLLIMAVLVVYELLVIVLGTSGIVHIDQISGFDVDSADRVYISKSYHVDVYEGQKKIRSLEVSTSTWGNVCNYIMIQDDLLYVASTFNDYVSCYDLQGNCIEEVTDMDYEAVEEYAMQATKVHGTSVYEGKHLQLDSSVFSNLFFIPYTICKGDIVLHRMGVMEYVFNESFTAIGLLTILANGLLIWRDNRKESKSS